MNRIIALSGTHGTGKTTAAYTRAKLLKIEHPMETIGVLVDIEARCPYPINRQSSEAAQQWIFFNRIARELDMLAQYDLVVTDRTIMDVIAYTYALEFAALAADMEKGFTRHLDVYRSITLLRTVTFQYQYEDGIRDPDPAWRQKVEDILVTLYHRTGIAGQERYMEI